MHERAPLRLPRPPAENRYRDLFDEAVLGMYVSTPSGRLIACNPAFARLLGFASVDSAVGSSLSSLYESEADRAAFVQRVRQQRRLDPHRSRLRRQDGQFIDVLETVVGEFDASGALAELRGQLIDISPMIEIEAALRNREQQFRAIFDDAVDAILVLDDRRAIVEANPAARALFGLTRTDLGRQTIDECVIGGHEQMVEVWRELLALGVTKYEHRVLTANRTARRIDCSYRANVQQGRHLCIARDITERRALEDRLQQAEKIESVGRLAGGIAHDFNNLLTAMLGYTELLLATHTGDDSARADLEEIQKAGQRAAALTNQLLAFSRKQVLVPKDVDLNTALAGLRGMLSRLIREDISLDLTVAPAPALIRIDPNQIEQVVLNLVLNARDALPSGGRIQIEVANVAVTPGDAACDPNMPPGSYVRLRVVDNGVGMPDEVRAHIFEPFFTTKEVGKGTGLGLASVYGIVRQSNGFISVESEAGAGSTFTMHFPAVAAQAPDENAVEPVVENGGGETILLVEDEDAVRVIVGTILRRSGYRVLEAGTPRGACEIFRNHRAEISLLVTDVVMPEMNGPALAQRLVAEQPGLRVLFISGYANVATGAFDSNNPNSAFLSKPFQASTLTAKVRDILSRSRR